MNHLPTAVFGRFTSSVKSPYPIGTVAQLECDVGYRSNTVHQSKLTPQLTWDPPSATCHPVTCPDPPVLHEHGKRTGLDFTFPNSISYTCDPGYAIDAAPSTYYCSAAGNWQPALPLAFACRPIQCPEPQAPVHGSVDFVDRVFQSEAQFRCDPAFEKLHGDDTRTCRADGTWSGDAIQCTCPLLPEMKDVKERNATTVVLDCGQGVEDIVECLPNGQWSKQPPYCQPAPLVPPNVIPAPNPSPGGWGLWIFAACLVSLMILAYSVIVGIVYRSFVPIFAASRP